MLWSIVLAGPVVLLVWAVLSDRHPLDAIPGPKRLPIFGCVLEFFGITPKILFVKTRAFAKKYGDRFLIKVLSRRVLHVNHPDDVEAVLAHSKNITKSKAYSFLQPWLGTGLLLSTGLKWHKRRKILTPTFHFNILKNFATVMEEKSLNLVESLKKAGGKEMDLYPLISNCTLFTICETAMGTQLDQDQSEKTLEYKKSILQIGGLMLTRLTHVWLHNEFVFNNLPIGKTFNRHLDIVQSFANAVILDRKRQRNGKVWDEKETMDGVGSKRRMAMLDLLLEAESKGEIDLEGIREEVNTFMFEGHDTTAEALTFGMMLLADHEHIQDRVYEEIQQVVPDRSPSMSELQDLKFLEAVIKETLRLYPSVAFIARKITEDFYLRDLFVPAKNTEVAVHIYDLHRRPDLWSDPEAFKPDRFLDGSAPKHPYAYVPFSAGPRNCIGQRFAMMEMKYIMCEVLRTFKLVPREKGWRPELISDIVLRSYEPIYVQFVPRKQ